MMNYKNGSIIHIELPARDIEQAAAFYATLFDWQINTGPEYTGFTPSHGPAGGFNPLAGSEARVPIQPGDMMVYIACDEIDTVLQKVEEAGGKVIIPRSEISGIGWYGLFADPTGNRIGLLHFTRKMT